MQNQKFQNSAFNEKAFIKSQFVPLLPNSRQIKICSKLKILPVFHDDVERYSTSKNQIEHCFYIGCPLPR